MTHQERRDITHLYERSPQGVLFTLVESDAAAYPPGARMYATAEAGRAGYLFPDELSFNTNQPVDAGTRVDNGVLMEQGGTPESDALMQACMDALAGELRVVATLLPDEMTSLLRFVMDARGDVLFASESLETEDIVPLRRLARTSAHGVIHVSSQGRLFVEYMEAAVTEQRILEIDAPQVEAE